jgi:putative heme iron utilization protein
MEVSEPRTADSQRAIRRTHSPKLNSSHIRRMLVMASYFPRFRISTSARLLAGVRNNGTDLAFDDNLNREAFPAPFPQTLAGEPSRSPAKDVRWWRSPVILKVLA